MLYTGDVIDAARPAEIGLVNDVYEPEALEAEAGTQATLSTTRDHEEGVAAFIEDREPSFEGR